MRTTNHFETLNLTPTIPVSGYNNLPTFLKEITDKFGNPREKDVVLTGSLVTLSGCFTGIRGLYGKSWIAPNLFAFIVAPPASGKGEMKYCPKLGNRIQDSFIEANAKAMEDYAASYREWKAESKKNPAEAGNPPEKPKLPILFIPGNSSAAAIYWHLNESGGKAIICETEADTLTGAIKQDWGNFSHILRGSFQHEPIAVCRKGDNTYIRTDYPQLSVLLSGTPDQVPRLIGSTEDGLCSRFLFYCYYRGLNWIDQTPCDDCEDYAAFFSKLGYRVAKMKESLDEGKHKFNLTKEQFATLNKKFDGRVNEIRLFEGHDAGSAVIRLGLIVFRIAMILTVLRNEEQLKENTQLQCSDKDFDVVMSLADVYFEHSMAMYSLLPKKAKVEFPPKMRQFYLLLPAKGKFPRKIANTVGQSIGISERTVGSYLDKFEEKGYLTKPEFGYYQKPEDEKDV